MAKIAVVGDYPSAEETQKGLPFLGRQGELLEGVLGNEGQTRMSVYLDNAVACFPEGGDLRVALVKLRKAARAANTIKSFRNPQDCCRPRLFNALGVRRCGRCMKWEAGPMSMVCTCPKVGARGKPTNFWIPRAKDTRVLEVTIAAGNYALEALVGVTGINKWRGSPIDMVARAATAVPEVLTVADVEKRRRGAVKTKAKVVKSKKLKLKR